MLFNYCNKEHFNEYFFKKYLLEEECNQEIIKNLLSTRGLYLLVAPAGGGKTFSIINTIKQLIKENPNKVYVIACPNRIQNEQNQKQYNVKALVGGVNTNGELIISTVYDKSDDIKSSLEKFGKKELVLIIDEAHSLISAKKYRKNAIEKLIELSNIASTVVHMTATYRKLLHVYDYDKKVEFISKSDNINNIKDFSIIDTDNVKESILSQIRIQSNKNKLPVILINDKDLIQEYKVYLENQGFNVGVLDSDSKQGYIFNHIVEEEKIPKEVLSDSMYISLKKESNNKNYKAIDIFNKYKDKPNQTLNDIAIKKIDLILTTTVIEVGTNLKNTDLSLIYAVINSSYFDLDSIIQFFARAREKIDDGILLIPRQENKNQNNNVFKTVNTYIDEITETAQKDMKLVNACADFLSNTFYSNDVNNYLISILNTRQTSGTTLGKGVIVSENGIPRIDLDFIINKAYNKYDMQLLNNLNALKDILNGYIKTDNIIIQTIESLKALEEEKNGYVDDSKNELKRLKEMTSDFREQKKENIKEAMIRLYKFKQYELEEVLYNKQDPLIFGYSFNKDFRIIQSDSSIYKLLKESSKQKIPLEMCLALIVESETLNEAKTKLKEITYIHFNTIIPYYFYDDKVVRDDYSVFRKNVDDIISKRKKITSKLIYKICDDFKKIKLYKKEIKNYEKYLLLSSKNKKSSLSKEEKKDFEKIKIKYKDFELVLINEIKSLYYVDKQSYPLGLIKELPKWYFDILNEFQIQVNNYNPQSDVLTSNEIKVSENIKELKTQSKDETSEQLCF